MSVILIITFLFCLIFARFFYVQVVWGKELTLKACDQWNREIPIVAPRGSIYDRNGTLLVANKTTYRVFVRPNAVTSKEKCAVQLSVVLNTDPQELLEKLNKKNMSEVTVAKQVDKESIEKLVSLGLAGVYYSRDNARTYSYNDLLCQVLGFTASDGTGLTGLEKYYESQLCGINGEISYTTDIVGVETENTKIVYKEAVAGNNLKLTIDLEIQLAAESAMRKAYYSSGAKKVSCIILDPSNFDVLAMVNYPSYDLNDIPRDDMETLNAQSRNCIVSDIYEPGSTFKILTAAINLEEYVKGNPDAFSPTYVFNGSRTRIVDGTTIKCWSDHANGKHSNQTLAEALNNSCNPCFMDIALSIGKETFYEYLRAFGLGNTTGIDFGGEAAGLLLAQSLVKDCDLARIGFGQTIAVSGLQLACAAAAAVNGGVYYTPHLLKEVTNVDGKSVLKYESEEKSRVISEKASAMLAQMLEGVVTEGSGKKAYIEGYKVAGKTGTAQKFEDGHIAQGKYVSSFIGFFPSNKPQYLALIIVDEPQGVYYGSAVAAPVAKEIFEDIIEIKNISRFE
ncbi:MAG: peptidoglycan D,D-transpeptidase FtsI family protein [Candidatus Coproplasma sp.]